MRNRQDKERIIMSIKDENGDLHYLRGDSFAARAIQDVLEKLNHYESEAAKISVGPNGEH